MRLSEVAGAAAGGALGETDFARARTSASRRWAVATAAALIPPLLAVPARPPTLGPRATVPVIPTRSSLIITLSLAVRTQAARTSVPAAGDRRVALLVPTA